MLPKIPPVWSLQQQQPSSAILLQPLNAWQTPQGVRLFLGLGGNLSRPLVACAAERSPPPSCAQTGICCPRKTSLMKSAKTWQNIACKPM